MQNDAAAGTTLPILPIPATLRDGREVVLREVRAQDKKELLDAFQRLSADSRYSRFMLPMRELPPAMLEAATHPVPERDFALVAVSGEGSPEEDIVAAARYVGATGSDSCEFAVTVADDWHGLGLATRLLKLLIARASARGLHCIEGFVLAANAPMRALARRLGFDDTRCPDDPALRIVRLRLG